MKAVLSVRRIIFIVLIVSGLFLRLWNLSSVPSSLFGDEIDVGLQAYSILTTNRDYMGNFLPVMFRSFAEYRLPMQLYMTVPFIKMFGLNELGVRGASVLMGFLSILGMFLLTKEFFGKRVSVIATLLLLFSPWHFMFSRQANDTGFLIPFTLFGTLFFIRGLKNYKYLLLSSFIWGLGIYSYATYSLFAPFFLIALTLVFLEKLRKNGIVKLFLAVIVGLIIISPYIHETFKGSTTKRVSDIGLITPDELEARVVQGRRWSGGVWSKLFYNKYTIVASEVFNNYTKAFSPNFLFASGDTNPRHNVEGSGQLHYFEVFTFAIGILIVLSGLKKKPKKMYLVLLIWLLLAPIPSSLTKDGGTHAARLILMLPPITIFSALGIHTLFMTKSIIGKSVTALIVLLILFSVSRYMHNLFIVWPNESWRYWHYGFEETIKFVKSVDTNYEKIYFNNTYEPMLPRFLFYYEYDMKDFQKQFEGDVHIVNLEEGFDGFLLGDKYYFGDLKKPIERLAKPGNLVIASGEKDVTNPGIFDNPGLDLLHVTTSPKMDSIFYVFSGS